MKNFNFILARSGVLILNIFHSMDNSTIIFTVGGEAQAVAQPGDPGHTHPLHHGQEAEHFLKEEEMEPGRERGRGIGREGTERGRGGTETESGNERESRTEGKAETEAERTGGTGNQTEEETKGGILIILYAGKGYQ
jgi:hypothetical protein